MQTIQVSDVPVIMKDQNVVEFQVSKIGLLAFHKLSVETSSLVPGGGKKWAIMNKRLRIKHQVKAIASDGQKLSLDDTDITQLPIQYAKHLDAALNDDGGKPGTILNTGDGISSPILYGLGVPIPAQFNNEKSEIVELEFMAKTFGDIEEVLAETDPLGQTVALLRQVAKPLGLNDTLQRLPEWALEKVSLADAFFISENVLPRFLE